MVLHFVKSQKEQEKEIFIRIKGDTQHTHHEVSSHMIIHTELPDYHGVFKVNKQPRVMAEFCHIFEINSLAQLDECLSFENGWQGKTPERCFHRKLGESAICSK